MFLTLTSLILTSLLFAQSRTIYILLFLLVSEYPILNFPFGFQIFVFVRPINKHKRMKTFSPFLMPRGDTKEWWSFRKCRMMFFFIWKGNFGTKKILPRPSLRPKSDWTGANTIVLQSSLLDLFLIRLYLGIQWEMIWA